MHTKDEKKITCAISLDVLFIVIFRLLRPKQIHNTGKEERRDRKKQERVNCSSLKFLD